jgi:hypothetical protein
MQGFKMEQIIPALHRLTPLLLGPQRFPEQVTSLIDQKLSCGANSKDVSVSIMPNSTLANSRI